MDERLAGFLLLFVVCLANKKCSGFSWESTSRLIWKITPADNNGRDGLPIKHPSLLGYVCWWCYTSYFLSFVWPAPSSFHRCSWIELEEHTLFRDGAQRRAISPIIQAEEKPCKSFIFVSIQKKKKESERDASFPLTKMGRFRPASCAVVAVVNDRDFLDTTTWTWRRESGRC